MRKSDAILTEMSWLKSADVVLVTKSMGSFSFVLLAILSTTLRVKDGVEAVLSSLGSSFMSSGGMAAPASGVRDAAATAAPVWSAPLSVCCPILESSFSCGDTLMSISGISSFTLASVLRKC